jgi:hypothetical protein
MRRIVAAVGAVLLACAAVTAQPGAADQQAAAASEAFPWPARAPIAGAQGALGIIRRVEAPHGLSGFQPGPVWAPSEEDTADAVAVAGAGAVSGRGPRVEFEGSGSFLFRPARAQPRAQKRPVAREFFKYVSASRAPTPNAPESPGVLRIQRTWFGLYDSTAQGAARGVALVMPGLFNTPEPVIEHAVKTLQGRGWVVLRMMAQPSRFTERVTFRIDAERLEPAASRIADLMQDRAAECAFAVQAAFAHVLDTNPEYAALPRVAVGMSGGAMTLPTVVCREPAKYAAVVLIAGGADFLTIAMESNYRFLVDAMTFEWAGARTPERVAQLQRLYRETAKLDSLHTASALRGKPVLMLHGTHDGAVPAHLGDELWERLGKPERWSEEAGHEELFMRLPQKAGRICDWIAEKTIPTPQP